MDTVKNLLQLLENADNDKGITFEVYEAAQELISDYHNQKDFDYFLNAESVGDLDISHKLYNALYIYMKDYVGLHIHKACPAQIESVSISEFKKIRGVGKVTVNEFLALCKMAKLEPQP